jgi:hypothetical protein
MTSESRNSSLLGNGSLNTFPRKRKRNSRRAVFSVDSAAFVATQRCCENISAAVNQYVTIEEAVLSVGAVPRLYNEDLTHLELKLS